MTETILTILIFFPLIVAAIGTAFAWRRITRRTLFFVISCFSMLGVQSLIAPAAVATFLPSGGGITSAAAHSAFSHSVQISATLVVIVGAPLLWWLSHPFRRT
jgi:hypothetical protein